MTTRTLRAVLLAATAALAACGFDIGNPNSPTGIGPNPSRARVEAAAIGLLNGLRSYYPGWILNAGIIGREGYRFDGSEPRYTSEVLTGQLDAGGFIGTSQWAAPYRDIRSANELLKYIDGATELNAAEISATKGYAHTLQALAFMNVLVAHTQDSIPVDVGTDVSAPPAPFVSNAAAWARVEQLLDDGYAELNAGGTGFPFSLSSGFSGFDDPGSFATVNRALAARVDIYLGKGAEALTDLASSFEDSTASMDLGAYNFYSTGSGEVSNTLNRNTQENFAHPQLRDSAQSGANGIDQRYLAKVFVRDTQTTAGLTSDLGWNRYPGPGSSIPIIRNEELLLIHAEAAILANDLPTALAYINQVRVTSGGLDPLPPFASAAAATNALLYERRYSLLYEWGHRWIDMRRYGRLGQLPIDRNGDVVYSTFPIPTDEVLARQ